MGGSFSGSYGRNSAWRKDPVAEQQRAKLEQEKVESFRSRVVGRRVSVTSDIDYGREGVVTDVVDGMLAVVLDGEADAHFFDRHELQAVAS